MSSDKKESKDSKEILETQDIDIAKLRHDLRSELYAVFNACEIMATMPNIPDKVQAALKLINEKRDPSMEKLEHLFKILRNK